MVIMKEKLRRFLEFIRLLDSDNNISLTNIMIILCLYKTATAPVLSMRDLSLFVIPMLSYIHKRHIRPRK